MPTPIRPRNLAQVGSIPPATEASLSQTLAISEGVESAHLFCTLKSFFVSPHVPGDIESRFCRLVAPRKASVSSGFQPLGERGLHAASLQGVRTGLDYATASLLPPAERQHVLGAADIAFQVAHALMQRNIQGTRQSPEQIRFPQPAGLHAPMLCADGAFCEKIMVMGTALESHGAIDCAAHPQIEPEQWEQLAPMMPLLHAHVGNLSLLEPLGLAWLATGTPYESIIFSEAYSFYAHTCEPFVRRGRPFVAGPCPLPQALQSAALAALPLLPKDRWLKFAELLHAGKDSLLPMHEQMPATVEYLAEEIRATGWSDLAITQGNRGLPEMPVAVRMGLARVLATAILTEPRKIAVCHALQVLTSHTVSSSGRRAAREMDEVNCSHDVVAVARILSFMDGEELHKLIEGVETMSGSTAHKSTASFQDVATMVQVLGMLSRSIRGTVVQLTGESVFERHSAYRLWDVMAPLQDCTHTNTSAMLRASVKQASRLKLGLDGLIRFLEVAAAMPERHVKPTSDLLSDLLKDNERGFELAPFIFEALSGLSPEEQAAILTHREAFEIALLNGSRGGLRAERLMDLDRLKTIIGRFARPVAIRTEQLPAVDVENVMTTQRIRDLQEDMKTLQGRFSQVTRRKMGEAHNALRAYLQSSSVAALGQQARAGSTEQANALRALTIIESAQKNQVVDTALLLALVWAAIESKDTDAGTSTQGRDRRNMRYSLAQNLAQCIEDDGHAVCFWGQGQRMVNALGGYGFNLSFERNLLRPDPKALLSQLGSQFLHDLGLAGVSDPTPAQVDRFVRESLKQAQQSLQNPAEVALFSSELRATLVANGWQTSQS